jgi:hypothetical protein
VLPELPIDFSECSCHGEYFCRLNSTDINLSLMTSFFIFAAVGEQGCIFLLRLWLHTPRPAYDLAVFIVFLDKVKSLCLRVVSEQIGIFLF